MQWKLFKELVKEKGIFRRQTHVFISLPIRLSISKGEIKGKEQGRSSVAN
jgi:hypothetical protein